LLLSAVHPPLSIDISRLHGAQQQTRRSGVQRASDGTDRRTDGRTLDRFIHPAPHAMRGLAIIRAARKPRNHDRREYRDFGRVS